MFNTIDGGPEEIYGFKARLWARVVVGDEDCGHTRGARTTGPHTRPTRPDNHRLPCQLIVEVIRWWIRTLVRSLQTRRHPCQPRPGVLSCSLAHLPIFYSWQTSFLQVSKCSIRLGAIANKRTLLNLDFQMASILWENGQRGSWFKTIYTVLEFDSWHQNFSSHCKFVNSATTAKIPR